MMRDFIRNRLLPKVLKPARYLGTELNSIHKDWDRVDLKVVFAFPDVYEIGMSHLGLRILYHVVNKRPDTLMERVFAPWVDMEELLRQQNIPLFALESYKPVKEFDIVAFTLQYEMSFTNILNMLDLAGIPVRAGDRDESYPLVIAGGPCAYNPEPLADFIDAFVIGEGEEVFYEVLDVVKTAKQEKLSRTGLLERLAQVQGVYVPRFYDVDYKDDAAIAGIRPNNPNAPAKVTKRLVRNIDEADFPTSPIVPYLEVVHNRIMLEVLRGCSRGCRFCQAGMIYRPVREKSPETLLRQAEELVANTGYDEISLSSLSTADYSCVEETLKKLLDIYSGHGVNVSLPSLRADAFSIELAKEVQRVRRPTLTFAPEAGTQRLRDVINKGVTEEDLLAATGAAFKEGWTAVKLYFMIGLPTETEEDLRGIAELAGKVVALGQRELGAKAGRLKVTVSASSFVPKAHTPFQWEPQNDIDTLKEKQRFLAGLLKNRKIKFNWHDAELSFLEAVFSRGNRKVGRVLEAAWRRGCKFDSWNEQFSYDKWMAAFADVRLTPEAFACRRFGVEEVLPWDHIDAGVGKKFLAKEYEAALKGATTLDCRFDRCTGCGVCPNLGVDLDIKGREACGPV
ncbi:radical SAM protein [Thermincola ferriacetica]|uniref:Radical SAM protein n=1 Tax=Thermincola ferriacetica TaxID=281456 RepID=A0A0L6W1V4_9FIRM|nr:TIGR03960 family B12-binding radical SAM protein [Thermincola ferriacetica]KNZ69557.1 radical SAM protein [Thermincola ferriacetica]